MLNRPDIIEQLHRTMVEAGADGRRDRHVPGLRLKLEEWGLADHTLEINVEARPDRPQGRRRGPLRRRLDRPDRLPPVLRRSDARRTSASASSSRSSREQARGLLEGGVDLIIIETAQDILEVKAAIFGAREAMQGDRPRGAAADLGLAAAQRRQDAARHRHRRRSRPRSKALKVDVIGLNCSTGPEDMRDAIRYLGENAHDRRSTASPTPASRIRATTARRSSREKPEALADALGEFVEDFGVTIVGGCCGTTPEHIRAIVERVRTRAAHRRRAPKRPRPRGPALDDRGRRPGAGAARRRSSASASTRRARARPRSCCSPTTTTASCRSPRDQVEGGAHVLDLCVALTERTDEAEQMRRGRQAAQPDAARADPDRLDRAGRDQDRRSSRSRAARSSTRSTSRPAATRWTPSCRWRSSTAPR